MTATDAWSSSELAGTNRGLTAPVRKFRMWTPPAPRPYQPKADSPGQRITWTREHDERTGTIWSAGPPGIRSAWVQPDDTAPGDMVLVHLGTLAEQTWYDAAWQHDTVRRCNHVSASPGIYAEERTRTDFRGQVFDRYVARWHCDPDCTPGLRPARSYEPTRGDVIHSLLAREMRHDYCQTCVWLNTNQENTP